MNIIEKTLQFLEESFDNSDYNNAHPEEKRYRLEHSYRVANLGRIIAEAEGLHVDGLVVGCLLHDLSYCGTFESREDHLNHGRTSARLARDFVYGLDIPEHIKEELLYGIAIHVDDKSDFEGPRTVLAETISECDNIDRFDKYRLYEAMKWGEIESMTISEQQEFAKSKVERLTEIKKTYQHKTETSNKLWNDNLDYQIEYFGKLFNQLNKDRNELLK